MIKASFDVDDIVGKKFNRLTVIRFLEKEPYKNRFNYWYECTCECGKTKKISRASLLTFHTQSCGCYKQQHQAGQQNSGWKGCGEISGRMWSAIKAKAEDRKLSFTISIQDAWNIFLAQERKCALTGQPLSLTSIKGLYSKKTASLDRIDNTKGYDLDNVQWVHKDINWMKGKFKTERFIELCRLVSKHKG